MLEHDSNFSAEKKNPNNPLHLVSMYSSSTVPIATELGVLSLAFGFTGCSRAPRIAVSRLEYGEKPRQLDAIMSESIPTSVLASARSEGDEMGSRKASCRAVSTAICKIKVALFDYLSRPQGAHTRTESCANLLEQFLALILLHPLKSSGAVPPAPTQIRSRAGERATVCVYLHTARTPHQPMLRLKAQNRLEIEV